MEADTALATIVRTFKRNRDLAEAMRACGALCSITGVALIYLLSGQGRSGILTSILRPIIYGEWGITGNYVNRLEFVAHFTRYTVDQKYWFTPVMANGRDGPYSPENVHPPFLAFLMRNPIAVGRCNWQDDYTLPNTWSAKNLASVLMEGYYGTTGLAGIGFDPRIVLDSDMLQRYYAGPPVRSTDSWKSWMETGAEYLNDDLLLIVHPKYLELAAGVRIITEFTKGVLVLFKNDNLLWDVIFGAGLNRPVPYAEESLEDSREVIQQRIRSEMDIFCCETAYPFVAALRRGYGGEELPDGRMELAEVAVEAGVPPILISDILNSKLKSGVGFVDVSIVEAVIAAGISIFDDFEEKCEFLFLFGNREGSAYTCPNLLEKKESY